MSAAGEAFVTPHALRQFLERIAPLPENLALAAILHGIAGRTRHPLRPSQQARCGYLVGAVEVWVWRPYAFRAVLVPGIEGPLPVVVTIVPHKERLLRGETARYA